MSLTILLNQLFQLKPYTIEINLQICGTTAGRRKETSILTRGKLTNSSTIPMQFLQNYQKAMTNYCKHYPRWKTACYH